MGSDNDNQDPSTAGTAAEREFFEQSTDVRKYWYPLIPSAELDAATPVGLHLLDDPLVIYRAYPGGDAVIIQDKCPHRAAPLSLGRIVDGHIECKYHGWQFDSTGACSHIPSYPPAAKPPLAAHVRQYPTREVDGWIWVWPGASLDSLDKDGPSLYMAYGREQELVPWSGYVDLDIDHSLLVENFLDPAHLPFVHKTTISKRSNVTPIHISAIQFSPGSMKGRQVTPRRPDLTEVELEFRTPCTVALKFKRPKQHEIQIDNDVSPPLPFDQTFYAIPTQKGKCRFIYFQRMPFLPSPTCTFVKYFPPLRWLISWYLHRFNQRVLYEDYALLKGLQRNLAKGAKALDSRTVVAADGLVVKYRAWWRRAFGRRGKRWNVWFAGYNPDIEDIVLDTIYLISTIVQISVACRLCHSAAHMDASNLACALVCQQTVNSMQRSSSFRSHKSSSSSFSAKQYIKDDTRRSSESLRKERGELSRSGSLRSERGSLRNERSGKAENGVIAVALYDYRGATDEELNFNEGDTFEILTTDNPEWWYVCTRNGQKLEGYVPTTYVRKLEDNEVSENQMKDSGEEEGTSESESDDSSGYETSAEDSQEDDEEDMGEDEQNDDSVDAKSPTESSQTSGEEEEDEITVTPTRVAQEKGRRRHRQRHHYRRPSRRRLIPPDPLKGFGILPQGFRFSTLGKTYEQGIGRLSKSLTPKLTPDGLCFKDLLWDHKKDRIKKLSTTCTIAFSLLDARYIPIPGPHVRILGRCVRMALFDKASILSNIHAVPAVYNPEFEHLWKFSSKASLLFPKDDENTCFLRVNDVDVNLCILFEFCMIVEKESRGDRPEIAQLSCGWGLLPLFTTDGGPIENKTYDIKLYGGTPFEKNVRLYEEIGKQGLLQSLIQPNKTPRLNVRVWKLGSSALRRLNHLPGTLISFLSAVPALSMYRQILADVLVAPKRDQVFSTIGDSVLGIFPLLAEQNDLLRLLVMVWERTWRTMKRSDKRSFTRSKQQFTRCVMAVWPLLHVREMPDYIPGYVELSQARQTIIHRFQEVGVIDYLGKNPAQATMRPFNTVEVQFNCLAAIAAAK
ncbi:uncharacterized protein SPPG_03748 [Spizellomyces punctatus DAOM BR117]|uniref:SH3 domain-containing protein n=1 Tax=Spizellomyces punctatus (strain DAOM BR117) TaxID=645134 RepID=A0A0L0HIC6_SPIPD|nr:uncharacterized protein SPPG_03748 [Spizellomyces punctatus DAOM BR117]KND00620.1 hypothetical protein SPPG_03748 [Spizellomyces punctatus DAOM BR117]|eukprot:XP_016608659.1 hypothetical protein SPPG_03748 [Spizellomyces punctatus DAOM BR117]